MVTLAQRMRSEQKRRTSDARGTPCCRAGSSSLSRSPISGFCSWWRATATACARSRAASVSRLWIYPLSLAIYCTSWTFFGSVGLASRGGFDFLTIYIGPMLMVGLGYPLIVAHRAARQGTEHHLDRRPDRRALRQEPGGGGDRGADRHRRHDPLHRAAAQSGVVFGRHDHGAARRTARWQPMLGDSALFVALFMAAFAVLFGTRHIDATEHQDGLMLAIATESIVKLVAFLAVGIFVTFVMFPGPLALVRARAGAAADRGGADARAAACRFLRHDGAVAVRDRAAAAPIPRQRGREPQRGRNPPRRLAVPALSGAHQSVCAADRDRRPARFSARPLRRRHVRAGAAAHGPFEH